MRHGVRVAVTGKLAEVSSRVICLDSKRLYLLGHHFGPHLYFSMILRARLAPYAFSGAIP